MRDEWNKDRKAAQKARRAKAAQDAARTPDGWRNREERDAVIAVRDETIGEFKAENELLLLRIGELKLNKEVVV